MQHVVSPGAPNSVMDDNNATQDGTPCRICRESMKPGAQKCVHCDSYQDWRRFLTMSNTVLALLVALISVLTVLLPIASQALQKDVSNVALSFHGVHENLFNLAAVNSGSKDAVIAEESLLLKGVGSSQSFQLEPRFDQVIVPGGATRQFTTRLSPLDFGAFVAWLDANPLAAAEIHIRAENYGAEDWSGTFVVSNSEIKTISRYARMFPVPASP